MWPTLSVNIKLAFINQCMWGWIRHLTYRNCKLNWCINQFQQTNISKRVWSQSIWTIQTPEYTKDNRYTSRAIAIYFKWSFENENAMSCNTQQLIKACYIITIVHLALLLLAIFIKLIGLWLCDAWWCWWCDPNSCDVIPSAVMRSHVMWYVGDVIHVRWYATDNDM